MKTTPPRRQADIIQTRRHNLIYAPGVTLMGRSSPGRRRDRRLRAHAALQPVAEPGQPPRHIYARAFGVSSAYAVRVRTLRRSTAAGRAEESSRRAEHPWYLLPDTLSAGFGSAGFFLRSTCERVCEYFLFHDHSQKPRLRQPRAIRSPVGAADDAPGPCPPRLSGDTSSEPREYPMNGTEQTDPSVFFGPLAPSIAP